MRTLLRLLPFAIVLLGSAVPAAADNCPEPSPTWREAVRLRINALRREGEVCGRTASGGLQWSPELERLAATHADWVAQQGVLDHAGRHGAPLGRRARSAGYRYTTVAENLAEGTASLEETLALWRRSESHCRNLYDDSVTDLALACRPGPGGPWWVMELGRRSTR